jgi:ATP-dependent helicase HrpB
MNLPIEELRPALREAWPQSNRIIVEAPTGSGKSTGLPCILREEFLPEEGEVWILQPRRLAARMLAARVAHLRGVPLGGEVGYQIRLDRVGGRSTRIWFMTEGILLRRMLEAPELPGVAAVLLDEFHERHLYGDISLAQLVRLQEERRPDLKLLVMSATLDGELLKNYLGPGCRHLVSEGRFYPVEVEYLAQQPGDQPVWELAAEAVARAFPQSTGHALVFMPGAYEISRTVAAVRAELGANVPVMALHGEMTARDQDEAVAPGGARRVIVSTNVAETSLTIDGVTLVVDSGLARVAKFDAQRGIDTLLIEKISRASAEQRAGRAGRTAPGRWLRLWTQYEHERRAARELPEVRRMDLAETVLTLKACGVGDLAAFRWLDPPEETSLRRAELLLRDLGALDHAGDLTSVGRRLISFPVHPRYGRLFLEAEKRQCVRAAALIAALAQNRSILTRVDRKVEEERQDLFGGGSSDFSFLFRAFSFAQKNNFRTESCRRLGIHAEGARQVARLFAQFLEIAERFGWDTEAVAPAEEELAKCVLAAFADQVGRRRSAGNYVCDLVHGRRGVLSKHSLAGDSWVVVAAEINEIGRGQGEAEVQLGLVTAIEEEWLEELYSEDFSETREVVFDATQNRVVERRLRRFRDLVLRETNRDATSGAETAACLAQVIRERRPELSGWGDPEELWIRRVNFVARHFPELEIPSIGAEERDLLLEQFCEDATCLRDLRQKAAGPVLRSWLRGDQVAAVERLAPERLPLPGGKTAKVQYSEQGEARTAARIQELFGLPGGLRVGGGRVPLTIEILAPNHRPVQVTQDLENFWRETYPQIKPQLQRRYPKHRWE